MLIDTHMHLFPDFLATRTLPRLSKIAGCPYHTDGTLKGTLAAMDAWGIDYGVVLHIATKERQQTTINQFAKKVQDQNKRLLCFGSVHPDSKSAVDELYRIQSMGLRGVKLHPDYQRFFFRDERYFPLYETIAKLKLPLTIHAGWDPVSPDVTHAPPADIAVVAKAFPELTIIAAHMGGLNMPEAVEKYLVGLPNVYFDTAMSPIFLNSEQYGRLIRKHGAERVLFGTDCPWDTSANELEALKKTGLSPDELDLILYKNASRLFQIAL